MVLSTHRVLFLIKPDPSLLNDSYEAISYLLKQNMDIIVEPYLYTHLQSKSELQSYFSVDLNAASTAATPCSKIIQFDYDAHDMDVVITFGGDGLLLHCSTLFNGKSMPPVMCFDFGSLGFLTPFYFENFADEVGQQILGFYEIIRTLFRE